jgi:hypothetical protein
VARSRKNQAQKAVQRAQHQRSSLTPVPLIVTVKEARKLLGKKNEDLTNEEVEQMVRDYELLSRHAIRDQMVRKNTMVY